MTREQLIAAGYVKSPSGEYYKPLTAGQARNSEPSTVPQQDKSRRVRKASDAVEREADLHNAILDWCRENGWVALHGTMAKATGRTIGELDFTLVGPRRVLFVEGKNRHGKLTPAQQAMIAQLTKLGHRAGVVRSMREFVEFVRNEPPF